MITELCAQLDNLPLAVELAAARSKALSLVQILERLSSRLDLLKGGRDADPRQQTLRATIEWSYDLLSSAEQQLFARLSVFAGGCTLEAAAEVADADLDTLQSLVEKSLVRYSNERYWMLETIRDHAAQKLTNAPDRDDVRRRHAEWFVRIADQVPDDVQEGRVARPSRPLRSITTTCARRSHGSSTLERRHARPLRSGRSRSSGSAKATSARATPGRRESLTRPTI